MLGVPISFRKGGDASASYDWVDFSTGLGYRRFYAAAGVLAAGLTYFLTNESSIDSSSSDQTTSYGYLTPNDGAGSELDIDFDVTLVKPMTIGAGYAYVNFTVCLATNPSTVQSTVNIYHVTAAGVETLLGTAQSAARHTHAAALHCRDTFRILLTGKTFGVGEKLRVNYVSNASDASFWVYHDPSSGLTGTDAGGRTVTTDFTVDIPFKIDI
ncbi:MAG: hypothetical protein PHV93_04645 [Candidatus Pacebacteria bacterium]|nr:hypothetical protein [Candidatus Paceibacterota bacterium]